MPLLIFISLISPLPSPHLDNPRPGLSLSAARSRPGWRGRMSGSSTGTASLPAGRWGSPRRARLCPRVGWGWSWTTTRRWWRWTRTMWRRPTRRHLTEWRIWPSSGGKLAQADSQSGTDPVIHCLDIWTRAPCSTLWGRDMSITSSRPTLDPPWSQSTHARTWTCTRIRSGKCSRSARSRISHPISTLLARLPTRTWWQPRKTSPLPSLEDLAAGKRPTSSTCWPTWPVLEGPPIMFWHLRGKLFLSN